MGCIPSKSDEHTAPPQQQVFSWDREDRPDPKDFTIENQTGVCCGRTPGTINGQQFIINNCTDCSIYLFDHSAMVTIDNCQNCRIYLGPVKGSVFIRNCKNMKCVVACQQFRSRDCCKVDTFLLCATQPVIETSASMKFGCFQFYYPELATQFEKASLSIYNNTWCSIHDFTPTGDGDNWSLIADSVSRENHLPRPGSEEFQNVDISYDIQTSVVPLTRGTKRTNRFDESCLLVFFADTKSKCLSVLNKMGSLTEFDIIQTKEIKMSVDDADRIFKNDKYRMYVEQGSLVGLELNGNSLIRTCEEVLKQFRISLQNIYLSTNENQGKADIDAFHNYVDMSMS